MSIGKLNLFLIGDLILYIIADIQGRTLIFVTFDVQADLFDAIFDGARRETALFFFLLIHFYPNFYFDFKHININLSLI